MRCSAVLVAILGSAALCFAASSGAAPPGPPSLPAATVSFSGQPGNGLIPFAQTTMTTAQVAAQPNQKSLTIGGTTYTGPLLSALLTTAGFTPISSCKNDELRYWTEVSGLTGAAAVITNGELDTGFGNRPAILAVTANGTGLAVPQLIVPGDTTTVRDIPDVFDVTVGRAAPQLTDTATPSCTAAPFTPPVSPTPPAGDLAVNGDVANPSTLGWSELSALPQFSQTDTFQAGSSPTTVTEEGPTIAEIVSGADPLFQAGRPNDDLRFYVEYTSSEDGYAALSSMGEFGTTRDDVQMLASLIENGGSLQSVGPRSTAPGDPKGGRYVSGGAVLSVFRAPTISPAAGSGPNLAGSNLLRQNLSGGYLVGASLQGANLNGAQLEGSFLDVANLSAANLNGANLSGALLNGAELAAANLHGANLTDANLSGADLSGANLKGSDLTGVTWSNTVCPDGSNSDADGGTC
jgi:hypothetical protein